MDDHTKRIVDQAVVLLGGAFGAAAEWLLRPEGGRHILMAAFSAAWLAMGLQALFVGRLALRGRHGDAKVWLGASARWIGALMSVAAVGWYGMVVALG